MADKICLRMISANPTGARWITQRRLWRQERAMVERRGAAWHSVANPARGNPPVQPNSANVASKRAAKGRQ